LSGRCPLIECLLDDLLIFAFVLFFSPIRLIFASASPAHHLHPRFPRPRPALLHPRPSDGRPLRVQGRLSADSDEADDFDLDFTIGANTRQKISTWRPGRIFSKRRRLPPKASPSPAKRASLQRRAAHRRSHLQLLFERRRAGTDQPDAGFGATLEFGHRLQYDHHYQKLALDEELKRMEEASHNRQLTRSRPFSRFSIVSSPILRDERNPQPRQRLLQRRAHH